MITVPNSLQLSAPSSEVVWALIQGDFLYRSTDRGDIWAQRPMPPVQALPQPEVSFVNGMEGWLSTGGAAASGCSADHTDIWHTTDGGATWTLLGSTGIADSRCKEGLSFVDSRHGFLGAWDDSNAPVIYGTADGGVTWKVSRSLPDPPGFESQAGGFTLHAGLVRQFGTTLLVPAQGNSAAATGIEVVFRSTDGGGTWTYLATAKFPSDAIALVSLDRWVQHIPPGQSVETTDAGKTWHHYPSDYSQAAPIAPEIVFGDAMVGYWQARAEIHRTLDGGLHWTNIKTPGT
jgi:photosystem II stability/assembly factor-like uncharacterized protein